MDSMEKRHNGIELGNINAVYGKSPVVRQVSEVLRSTIRLDVQDDHFVSILEQPPYQVTTDKPSTTSN